MTYTLYSSPFVSLSNCYTAFHFKEITSRSPQSKIQGLSPASLPTLHPSLIKLCNFRASVPLAMLRGTHQPGRDTGLHPESHLLKGQKFHLPKNYNCVKRASLTPTETLLSLLYVQTRIFYRGTGKSIFTYGHSSPVNTQHSKHFLYSTPMLQLKQSLSQYREENSEVFSESDVEPHFSPLLHQKAFLHQYVLEKLLRLPSCQGQVHRPLPPKIQCDLGPVPLRSSLPQLTVFTFSPLQPQSALNCSSQGIDSTFPSQEALTQNKISLFSLAYFQAGKNRALTLT